MAFKRLNPKPHKSLLNTVNRPAGNKSYTKHKGGPMSKGKAKIGISK